MRGKLAMTGIMVFAVAVVSCERYRTLDIPSQPSRLVVHAYVETGDLFSLSVGRSYSSSEATQIDQTYVINATVVLYEDDIIIDTLYYDSITKRYVSLTARAVPGKTYKVVVSAGGFETVEAVTKAPLPVPAISVTHQIGTGTNTVGDVLDNITFRFKDPPGVSNYYMAIMKGGYRHQSYFCVYTYDPVVENYQTAVNPFEQSSCIFSDEILYNDRSFNGLDKQITLSAGSDELQPVTDQQTGEIYRPYLKRYNVPEELYRYVKTESSLNILSSDPFASPVVIGGNVRNGYGIFAVLGVAVDTLR